MIGVPLMGALLASHGWRAPFIGLAAAAVICSGLTLFLNETPHALAKGSSGQFAPGFKAIVRNRSALAFVAAWFLIFFAFENIQISYGSWLETHYGLSTTARGSISTLFGVFELMASGGSSLLLDRIGKKRGVVGGLISRHAGLRDLVHARLDGAALGLGRDLHCLLGFEFSVVSGISVMSEQVPTARGTMLALAVSVGAVGRMVAAPLGSALTASGAFTTVALISLLAGGLNASIFAFGVKDTPSIPNPDFPL